MNLIGSLALIAVSVGLLFFGRGRDGAILRGEIHHAPWELERARASVSVNTMAESLGLPLAGVLRVVGGRHHRAAKTQDTP